MTDTEPTTTPTLTLTKDVAPGAEEETLAPLKPRLGTIVWGSILLVVAFLAIFASQVDFSDVTPAVIVWTVIGFGSALVLAAIVTAIVRAASKASTDRLTR